MPLPGDLGDLVMADDSVIGVVPGLDQDLADLLDIRCRGRAYEDVRGHNPLSSVAACQARRLPVPIPACSGMREMVLTHAALSY